MSVSMPPSQKPADPPRFLPAGDGAVVVEFGSAVDEALSDRVMAMDARIAEAGIEGVVETVPTYRSLLVVYDPLAIRARQLIPRLAELAANAGEATAVGRRWVIPVCYGGDHGEDLEWVAKVHDMTPEEVIALHSEAIYRVYMIGFTPGFAYLGGLPEILHTPRRETPRTLVPAGSVAIGGQQAAVFSVAAPSGWHMLGRTPVRTFDLKRDDPFLIAPGDRIRFSPVAAAEFAALAARAEAGDIVAWHEEEA